MKRRNLSTSFFSTDTPERHEPTGSPTVCSPPALAVNSSPQSAPAQPRSARTPMTPISMTDWDESLLNDTPLSNDSNRVKEHGPSSGSLARSSTGLLSTQSKNPAVNKPLPALPEEQNQNPSRRLRPLSWLTSPRKGVEDLEVSPLTKKQGAGRLSISSPILQSTTHPVVAAAEGVPHINQPGSDPKLFGHRIAQTVQRQTTSSWTNSELSVTGAKVTKEAVKSPSRSAELKAESSTNDPKPFGRFRSVMSRRMSSVAGSNSSTKHDKFSRIVDVDDGKIRMFNSAKVESRSAEDTDSTKEKLQTRTGHGCNASKASQEPGCVLSKPLPKVSASTQSVNHQTLPIHESISEFNKSNSSEENRPLPEVSASLQPLSRQTLPLHQPISKVDTSKALHGHGCDSNKPLPKVLVSSQDVNRQTYSVQDSLSASTTSKGSLVDDDNSDFNMCFNDCKSAIAESGAAPSKQHTLKNSATTPTFRFGESRHPQTPIPNITSTLWPPPPRDEARRAKHPDGLRSHPNVMEFSSPPVDTSTPRRGFTRTAGNSMHSIAEATISSPSSGNLELFARHSATPTRPSPLRPAPNSPSMGTLLENPDPVWTWDQCVEALSKRPDLEHKKAETSVRPATSTAGNANDEGLFQSNDPSSAGCAQDLRAKSGRFGTKKDKNASVKGPAAVESATPKKKGLSSGFGLFGSSKSKKAQGTPSPTASVDEIQENTTAHRMPVRRKPVPAGARVDRMSGVRIL